MNVGGKTLHSSFACYLSAKSLGNVIMYVGRETILLDIQDISVTPYWDRYNTTDISCYSNTQEPTYISRYARHALNRLLTQVSVK